MLDDLDAGSELRKAVTAFLGTGFAVVDGACFADLPTLMKRNGLFARSLFLEQGDLEIEKAGPWLVALDQSPDAIDKVLALAGVRRPVFWCCEAGEAALHRHLRTINMARIPVWAAKGRSAPQIDAKTYDVAFFRHQDPNVLGALLPCLDAAQFARILGPAQEIAFVTDDFGGLKRVQPDKAWPRPAAGMLTVTDSQCLAMIDRRRVASQGRIAAYLREHASAQTCELSDRELTACVERYDRQARRFGVCDEDAIALWSYMQMTSRVDLSREDFVVRFIADPSHGVTPCLRMNSLFQVRTRLLEDVAEKIA